MKTMLPLLVIGALSLLGACSPQGGSTGSVLEVTTNPSIARTFECLAKDANGNCLQNQCKQGPGGKEFDCAGFARDCVNAGEHWSGTKEGGKCTKVL
ncbi:MAG TPA: hypothetical protein VFQ55_07680 [Casimicrobiaceae bacterium]|jgi:hypothetical protein|nr:hypothetical protein [Casimicrobiaceae bacterium]